MHTETAKTAVEIGSLARKLTPNNQAYVLNTINTLLHSQQYSKSEEKKTNHEKVVNK